MATTLKCPCYHGRCITLENPELRYFSSTVSGTYSGGNGQTCRGAHYLLYPVKNLRQNNNPSGLVEFADETSRVSRTEPRVYVVLLRSDTAFAWFVKVELRGRVVIDRGRAGRLDKI
jgi:hypothetical protein